jgi:hypothetical protein
MELTKEQKKVLEVFSMYARGYGKKKVSAWGSIEGCELYFDVKTFNDEEGGSDLDSYPKISTLLKGIANELSQEALDSMDDCDGYGEIKFLIDCVEKDLTIQVYENVRSSTEDGSSDEIPSDVHFRGLIEYMKKNGYSIGHVYFNGGGDSGYIENNIDFSGGGSGRTPLDRFGKVEDYLYDMLNNTLSGWEIDAGSSGSFEINLNDDMIYLGINVYEYEMESVATLLRTEF